jgi:predicted RNA binding protein YcfA (HicA-like mRNA interferase family)
MGAKGKSRKTADLVRMLEADGWSRVRTKGDHAQHKHPTKPGLVTIDLGQRELPVGTLRSVYRQAGWKW